MTSRWLEESGGTRGAAYEQRFRDLAARGVDVHGEAAFVQRAAGPDAAVLDAGCGTGRVARELARRGHRVVGVDSDPSMLGVARRTSPDLRWVDADLVELDLDDRFDAVVLAGNVIVFVAPGTETQVLHRCADHLRPGGLVICGWATDRLPRRDYDAFAASAGLEPVARYATWDGDDWRDDADWCVAVDRRP